MDRHWKSSCFVLVQWFAKSGPLRKSIQFSSLALLILLVSGSLGPRLGAQTNEWTWMSGSSLVPASGLGQVGIYGTIGTASNTNVPGGRVKGSKWVDKNGNLWLFGGIGFDAAGTNGYLNDLWEFNRSTNQWTWVNGSSTVPGVSKGPSGTYGSFQVPASGNNPGGREDAISWSDSLGNLWLYGGIGFDSVGTQGYLNDLWMFNTSTNQWAWMGGSSTVPSVMAGKAGIYGTLGSPSAGNAPGGRTGAVGWTDGSGNIWLFGGYGFDASGTPGNLNDLWRFSLTTKQWTWIGGTSTFITPMDIAPGVYGTLGSPAANNIPGGRSDSTSWIDNNGNFWLFGGTGNDSVGTYGSLNDLWEYQPSANQWTWIGGSSTLAPLTQTIGSNTVVFSGQPGVYGVFQLAGVGNVPGGRYDAVTWTDKNGNLWLFGGYGFDSAGVMGKLNDLWEYQPSTGEWTWMDGTKTLSGVSGCASGVYGDLQTAAAGNVPGGRFGSISWTDSNGTFWLMSGNGCDTNGTSGSLNDLWQFEPSTSNLTQVAAPEFSPAPGTYTSVPTISITDSTPGATLTYSINSGAATPYAGPFKLSSTATVVAIAELQGYGSNSTSGVYVLNLPIAATPTFSLVPGNYTTPQTVTISDTTPGVTIYYSTSGVPTISSNVYTGPITLDTSATIRAIAVEEGYATSAIAAADYVIWSPSSTLEWAWMGGSNGGSQPQVTGKFGVPDVGNIPLARYQATTWTDKSGNFWLFGGDGYVVSGGIDYGLNDLWEYIPLTHAWAWIAGNSMVGQPGNYGQLATTSAGRFPGGRQGASGWTDNLGNLWLFGGYGQDANGTFALLNDMWKFNPSTAQWTWMSGSSTVSNCFVDGGGVTHCALPSTYGSLGVPAAGNTPGSREGATTWTDSQGNLWLFGGWSFDVANGVQYFFDEMWEYNVSTNQWTWMGGSNTRSGSACAWNVNVWYLSCGEPGVYGTMGTPTSGNTPGGRSDAAAWIDGSGNFWIFGGTGFDSIGYIGDTQDLWKFNPSTKQWTWMSGNNALSPAYPCDPIYLGGACSSPSVFGTLGTPAAGNLPTGRDHAVTWKDNNGNFWLFGGGTEGFPNVVFNNSVALNDLWQFSTTSNQWTFMGGNAQPLCGMYCAGNLTGVYGQYQTPAPGNNPGARFASAGWTDTSGNFWLFGGGPPPTAGAAIVNNDLWEYQPSAGTLPTTAAPQFSLPTGNYSSSQSVTISDATNGAYIYYTIDGSTPTIDSQVFLPGISQPISVQHSETLKAIAVAPGCFTSAVETAIYTLPPQAATPLFSLPTGTYTSFQSATISDSTPGATIFYTTDGTEPTSSSKIYSGPISITYAYTPLKAIATAGGYSPSNVASATYTLNLPTVSAPIFDPAGGTYNTSQTVTISDSTPGATIYYQINTGYPTTSSPVYTGPITVAANETVWAMATAPNYFPSGYSGAIYAIDPLAPQTAAPTFSVPAGTYTAPQTVTMSDATSGASIYFTTDGSTPSGNSTPYTSPVTISSSETLRAIAAANGSTASPVTTATYVLHLTAATPTFSLPGGTYNGSQTVALADTTTGAVIYYTVDGTTPTTSSAVYASPITVSSSQTVNAIAALNGYLDSAIASATYTINPLQPSFVLSALPASLTVKSGSQGSTELTVTPQNGFNSAVSFACSRLPSNATCSFSPATVTPSNSSASTQLTIAVSAQANAVLPGARPFLPIGGVFAVAFFLFGRRRRGISMVLILVALFCGLIQLCACGGGASSGGGGGGSPQSYSVTVTATSGTIQETTTVTLTEN